MHFHKFSSTSVKVNLFGKHMKRHSCIGGGDGRASPLRIVLISGKGGLYSTLKKRITTAPEANRRKEKGYR